MYHDNDYINNNYDMEFCEFWRLSVFPTLLKTYVIFIL
jgi:hypothetical protein